MPLERNGKKYLNAQESSEEYLGVAYVTFQRMEKRYGLKAKQWPDQGRQRFFLEAALQVVKETPIDQIEEAKKRIQELQEAE